MYNTSAEWINGILKTENLGCVKVTPSMAKALDTWRNLYKIDTEKLSLNLPSVIAAEYTRLITLEMEATVDNSLYEDYLRELVSNLRLHLEYGLAAGGMIIKPYLRNGEIKFTYITQGNYYPLSFDTNGIVTDVAFTEQLIRDELIYTKLEIHLRNENAVTVLNLAFKSRNTEDTPEKIPLTEVPEWSHLLPKAVISNVKGNLFGYFKTPFANVVEPGSMTGISIYAKAVRLIKEADAQLARIIWEYKSTENAIDVNEAYLPKDSEGNIKLSETEERLFRSYTVDTGINDKAFFNIFSPAIRDSAMFRGLNELLKRIEYACAVAYGTISDPQAVEKTATEIKNSKRRSYETISHCQFALQQSITEALQAAGILLKIQSPGINTELDTHFSWDDSIISDRMDEEKEISIMLQELAAGIISPEFYLMKRYNITEEEAAAILPAMEVRDVE